MYHFIRRKVYIHTYFVRLALISCDESPLAITFCHKRLLDDKRNEIFFVEFFLVCEINLWDVPLSALKPLLVSSH